MLVLSFCLTTASFQCVFMSSVIISSHLLVAQKTTDAANAELKTQGFKNQASASHIQSMIDVTL